MNDFDKWLEHYKATHGPLTLETMEASAAAWLEQQQTIDELNYIVSIFEDTKE